MKIAALGVLALILMGGVFAGGAYAGDAQFEATIVDKSCAGPQPDLNGTRPPVPGEPRPPAEPDATPPSPDGAVDEATGLVGVGANSTVTIRTFFGIEQTIEGFDDMQCWFLRDGDDGNFIVYHIRTERALFYEREGGTCIFDSLFGLGCVLPDVAGALDAAAAAAEYARSTVVLSTNGYAPDPTGQFPHSAPNCVRLEQLPTSADLTATWYAADTTQERLRLFAWAEDEAGNLVAQDVQEGGSELQLNLDLPEDAVAWVFGIAPPSDDPLQMGNVPSVAIQVGAAGTPALTLPGPTSCRPPA